jgi:hypothetical protein
LRVDRRIGREREAGGLLGHRHDLGVENTTERGAYRSRDRDARERAFDRRGQR